MLTPAHSCRSHHFALEIGKSLQFRSADQPKYRPAQTNRQHFYRRAAGIARITLPTDPSACTSPETRAAIAAVARTCTSCGVETLLAEEAAFLSDKQMDRCDAATGISHHDLLQWRTAPGLLLAQRKPLVRTKLTIECAMRRSSLARQPKIKTTSDIDTDAGLDRLLSWILMKRQLCLAQLTISSRSAGESFASGWSGK